MPEARPRVSKVLRLPQYSWVSGWRDLIAGLTVAAVALPQSIAYALIAGVDPKFGVYSAVVVTVIASIFGSSSHLINGPTSAISLLVFSSLAFIDPANRTMLFEALFLMGVLMGTLQILAAVVRLGWLASKISDSVVMGFMAAAALLLALGQVGNALGVKDKGNAKMHVLHRLWLTLAHGDRINYRAVILSAAVVVAAVALHRLVRHYRWPQIDLLAALVVAATIAHVAGWSVVGAAGRSPVALAARVPQSLPAFHVPTVGSSSWGGVLQGAAVIAFVGIIEALSIARAIAQQTGQKLDYNRQILAEGIANLAGGFFQCLPGSGSLSRSAINFHSGAATRFSGIIAAAAVAAALLLFAPLMHYVPTAALAGLLLVTAARLVDFTKLVVALRAAHRDAALVLVTFVTGVAVDLDVAILVGFALWVLFQVPGAVRRLYLNHASHHPAHIRGPRGPDHCGCA